MKNGSFITDLWERIFSYLSYLSIFNVIRLIKKKVSYKFVELWVMFNLIFSLLSSIIVYFINTPLDWFYYVFIIYGSLRIFEIMIYQLNVLLFDPYRAYKANQKYKIKSPTRLVVLLFHNYFEIICWFTTILISFLNVENALINSWGEYLKINLFHITTLNTSAILSAYEGMPAGASFIMYESVVGYVITLVTMARFIGLLPRTKSIDKV